MTTAELIRVLLLLDILGMAFLAAYYLSRRNLAWSAYLALGALAALLPVLGPFLVISLRPGLPRRMAGS